MASTKELIAKWEAQNEKLEPQTKVLNGSNIHTTSILAYQIRLDCINDLKQHHAENLKNAQP